MNKELRATLLRKGYIKVRHDLRITLGDAARALGVKAHEISELEHGKPEPIEFEDFEADLHCHRCQKPFRGKPMKGAVFAAYACPSCFGKDLKEMSLKVGEINIHNKNGTSMTFKTNGDVEFNGKVIGNDADIFKNVKEFFDGADRPG